MTVFFRKQCLSQSKGRGGGQVFSSAGDVASKNRVFSRWNRWVAESTGAGGKEFFFGLVRRCLRQRVTLGFFRSMANERKECECVGFCLVRSASASFPRPLRTFQRRQRRARMRLVVECERQRGKSWLALANGFSFLAPAVAVDARRGRTRARRQTSVVWLARVQNDYYRIGQLFRSALAKPSLEEGTTGRSVFISGV